MSHTITMEAESWEHTKELLKRRDARIAKLEGAIYTHRSNVWGLGEVQHPEDAQLYLVLARGE